VPLAAELVAATAGLRLELLEAQQLDVLLVRERLPLGRIALRGGELGRGVGARRFGRAPAAGGRRRR
jgi:hypothetical protein